MNDPLLNPKEQPQQPDTVDPHEQAMALTQMQIEQKQQDDQQAHEVMMEQMRQRHEMEKLQLQAKINAENAKIKENQAAKEKVSAK